MTLNKTLKVGAYTIAAALLCGVLTYYNFVDKVDASGGAVLYEECPDFTIAKYEKKHGALAVSEEEFVMSEHRGKVVVLNFWATWCEPCKKEIPHFAQLQKKYADSVEVVIINGETNDAQGLLDDFVNNENDKSYAEYYVDWTGYTCTFAVSKNVKPKFRVGDAFPVTIVVDKTGTIQYITEASMSYDELETVVVPYI